MKPKEALIKDGFLPPDASGRGRLSADGIARCKELAAQGWLIDGYETKAGTVEKVKHDPNRLVDVPEPSRPDSWTAMAGKVNVGMRKVCNNCRCSLTYCRCESPKVWVDHEHEAVVHFKQT